MGWGGVGAYIRDSTAGMATVTKILLPIFAQCKILNLLPGISYQRLISLVSPTAVFRRSAKKTWNSMCPFRT